MKLDVEVLNGVLVIRSMDHSYKVVIDVPTGDILHLDHTASTIQGLTSFLSKAKSQYHRFLNSQAVESFTE